MIKAILTASDNPNVLAARNPGEVALCHPAHAEAGVVWRDESRTDHQVTNGVNLCVGVHDWYRILAKRFDGNVAKHHEVVLAVEHLFTQALGLASSWKVVSCDFDPDAKSLELVIDFERGARFTDPETGGLCPVHDTVQRSWEHLRIFEHRITIHASVTRITIPSGVVKIVEVPWARPNGGFTLRMEPYLLALAKVLPVAEVSRQTSVSGDRIWHLIRTRIHEAWLKADWSSLNRLGVDETATRKGHKYGTVFLEISDRETDRGRGASKVARLLLFTPGKNKETFAEFAAELERRGVPASPIQEIAMDIVT